MSESLGSLHREDEVDLFGEDEIFGDREEFCARVVDTLNKQCDAQLDTSDPIASLEQITTSDVTGMAFLNDISIDELVPLELSSEQVESLMEIVKQRGVKVLVADIQASEAYTVKQMLQCDALLAVTREPDPLSPKMLAALERVRAEWEKIS